MRKDEQVRSDRETLRNMMADEATMDYIAGRVAGGASASSLAADLDIPVRIIRLAMSGLARPYGEVAAEAATVAEVQAEAETQARRAQKFMDKNRVERKTFREGARYYNAVEELTAEVRDLLASYSFSTPRHDKRRRTSGVGVVQLSDLHLNEVVELCDTLGTNAYSYEIAACRLRKFADECISLLSAEGVRSVLVLMTGDILNSDRRLDELLTNAGNRSKALVVAVDLLQQFIRHLAGHFDVEVMSVCGNESRKNDETTSPSASFTHNYDYDVHMMLAAMFAGNDTPSVEFHPVVNASEIPFTVGKLTMLAMHGHQFDKGGDKLGEKVARIVGKYARAGIQVDYIVFGHQHVTHISDFYSRSSSLVGANAYSNNSLQASGLASQNLYVVRPDGVRAHAVPLQDTDGVRGYGYNHDLVAGSGMRKSVDKAEDRKTVFKVVI